jgi:hypothetical protein
VVLRRARSEKHGGQDGEATTSGQGVVQVHGSLLFRFSFIDQQGIL